MGNSGSTSTTTAPSRAEPARTRLPAAQRRAELLRAATDVFARSNYRGATVAEIAREAGVSEPLLYKHFGSKRAIFCLLLERIGRRIVEIWEQETAGIADPLEALRVAGDVYLANLRAHPAEARLQFQALAEAADPEIAAVLQANHRSYVDFFARLVRAGQRGGTIRRDVDAHQAAWLLDGTGFAFTMRDVLDVDEPGDTSATTGLLLDWLAETRPTPTKTRKGRKR
ncbi:MAG: TetR/AcrR family transcriptional regulator [Acidimicrobiia bacterium]|nr:TetR/AcrR family transcriptional regulator [Acidimicrobiia bacterium]